MMLFLFNHVYHLIGYPYTFIHFCPFVYSHIINCLLQLSCWLSVSNVGYRCMYLVCILVAHVWASFLGSGVPGFPKQRIDMCSLRLPETPTCCCQDMRHIISIMPYTILNIIVSILIFPATDILLFDFHSFFSPQGKGKKLQFCIVFHFFHTMHNVAFF